MRLNRGRKRNPLHKCPAQYHLILLSPPHIPIRQNFIFSLIKEGNNKFLLPGGEKHKWKKIILSRTWPIMTEMKFFSVIVLSTWKYWCHLRNLFLSGVSLVEEGKGRKWDIGKRKRNLTGWCINKGWWIIALGNKFRIESLLIKKIFIKREVEKEFFIRKLSSRIKQ